MPNESECRTIIEEAYRIFAAYRIGADIIVCRCNLCVSADTERALIATPLREISAPLLAEYTNSAHGYDTGRIADELRYFLPRYLDLIAAGESPDHMGLDVCLRRLGYAEYRTMWPRVEAEIIDRFFDAFFVERLSLTAVEEWPAGWFLANDIVDALTLIVTAGGNLGRILGIWDRSGDPVAAIHMAALRGALMTVRDEQWLDSPYLDEYPEARQNIGAWLVRPEVTARVEATARAVDDPRLRGVLEKGLQSRSA